MLIILSTLVYKGGAIISFDFLFTHPTDGMTAGGIFPALFGTIWLVAVALLVSVPVGVAAAIYLSEYASSNVRQIVKQHGSRRRQQERHRAPRMHRCRLRRPAVSPRR